MNAAALDSGCVAAACVSSTQGSAALARRALQRSGELELLDPHARRHLHIRLQLRAELRVRRRQVLRTGCTPSERESANGGRTGGAAYDDGLVAPVRLHRGDRPSVQADLVLLHRIHSLRNTADNSQTPLSGEAQAGRGVLVSVFQQQGVPKQTPGPIRHPTKTTGCPTILATGLGLTPPGSLSRMRSLQPFSSQ